MHASIIELLVAAQLSVPTVSDVSVLQNLETEKNQNSFYEEVVQEEETAVDGMVCSTFIHKEDEAADGMVCGGSSISAAMA